jgi:REP element-mobilizing transposase RayT
MPRAPRPEIAGGFHHVYARGNNRGRIFVDDIDYASYVRLLARTVTHRAWRLLAYCLMPNHVHLLVETPLPNLGAGMQRLHGEHAFLFNRRHGRSGHLFQGRFGSELVVDEAHLFTLVGYVAGNPAEAALCASAADWPWSSHAATIGEVERPAWLDIPRLLECLDSLGGEPRARYAEAVAGRARGPAGPGPSERAAIGGARVR